MVQSLLASLNSETGLPAYITEMDLDYSDDTAQLNAYKQYMPLFMDAAYVKGIAIWVGFMAPLGAKRRTAA
jgi:hypothetical protein